MASSLERINRVLDDLSSLSIYLEEAGLTDQADALTNAAEVVEKVGNTLYCLMRPVEDCPAGEFDEELAELNLPDPPKARKRTSPVRKPLIPIQEGVAHA